MRALDFVVDGLSDVVEEADAARALFVEAELGGDRAHEGRGLDAVLQHVLGEAVAELECADEGDERFRDALQAAVQHGLFARAEDLLVDFLAHLLHELLDAGRVDAAVADEFFHHAARDFLADGVETADDDRFRGVVDEDVDAGRRLERADVASFAADDAALHLVVGERDGGGGAFVGAVAGVALDGVGEELLGFAFGALAGVLDDVADEEAGLVFDLAFEFFEDHAAGGLAVELGDALEFVDLAVDRVLELFLFLDEAFALLHEFGFLALVVLDLRVQGIVLAVEVLLFLREAFFLLGDLAAAFLDLVFDLVLDPEGVVLDLEGVALGGDAGFAEDLGGFALGVLLHFCGVTGCPGLALFGKDGDDDVIEGGADKKTGDQFQRLPPCEGSDNDDIG